MRKWLTASLFIGEWLLFFWVLYMIFLQNVVHLFNLIFTDMPWEEATLLTPFTLKIWLLLFGIGLCISFLLIVRIGQESYRRFMRIVWACLLGWNTINSLFWFIYSNGWNLSDSDRTVLLFMFIVSLFLTLLAVFRLIGRRKTTKTIV